MIFGYGIKQVNEFGLLQMKEITFSTSPLVLRQIAAFLNDAADKMENGYFERCSHIHIASVIMEWNTDRPIADVIVMAPAEPGICNNTDRHRIGGGPGV